MNQFFFYTIVFGFLNKDIKKQYEELCKRMRKLGKKIVVFVDDIDRLDQEEMTAVFQLVRNASNFPNMYFVMAYDKKYVINTLQGFLGSHGRNFTEKIFQEEYFLPKITEVQIQALLSALFEQTLDINESITERYRHIYFSRYLLNYRDVKRFFNALKFSYGDKKGKVDIRDFVLYTLLNFRYPALSRFITECAGLLFFDKTKDGYTRYWLSETERVKDEDAMEPIMDLTLYLKDPVHQEELGLKSNETILALNLAFDLWSEFRNDVTPLSINNKDNINQYLS